MHFLSIIAKRVASACGMLLLCANMAQAKTTIVMEYVYPDMFDSVTEELVAKFKKIEPDIDIVVRTKYSNYEDAVTKILRSAVTKSLPDVSLQGISTLRFLQEKGLAQPLDSFIAQEKNFDAEGFYPAMFDTARLNGKVFGLPFAVSLPVTYYNMDLAAKAGYTEADLPKTWDELYAFTTKVQQVTGANSFFSYWNQTGFWHLVALFYTNGASFMDAAEKKVTLNTPEGIKAFTTLRDMVKKGNMRPDYDWPSARADFAAGKMAALVGSSSMLQNTQESIGNKFVLKTAQFPDIREGLTLPVGGNAAVMMSTTPEKQAAAWKVIKFWCGVEGAKAVATKTGYMAPNKNAVAQLQDFFDADPNTKTVYNEQPYMADWYAFPGENGLKITDVLFKGMEKIITTDVDIPTIVNEMNKEVQRLVE